MNNPFWKLTQEEQKHFLKIDQEKQKNGQPHVLWGWKRDKVDNGKCFPESRTIYFSADLGLEKDRLFIKRYYFYLSLRASKEEIRELGKRIENEDQVKVRRQKDKRNYNYERLIIELGEPTGYDLKSVRRLLKRKPRLKIPPPKVIPESEDYDLSSYAPLAIYCGSGLSAESGLPLLGSIHEIFDVDRESGEMVFGKRDQLIERIIKNPENEIKKFCQFNVDAICVKPSSSHEIIAQLWQKGLIKQVLTDNLDHLLTKANVSFTQTRLNIFPDRFRVKFDPEIKALLVIGIAVDRRQVIRQARQQGLKVIVINPLYDVAPQSRNMDYLYFRDIFFKGKASEILPKCKFY